MAIEEDDFFIAEAPERMKDGGNLKDGSLSRHR